MINMENTEDKRPISSDKYSTALYNTLKLNNAYDKDYDTFYNDFYAPGIKGYTYRKGVYDFMKKGGVDYIGDTYEEFASKIGLHAIDPQTQQTPMGADSISKDITPVEVTPTKKPEAKKEEKPEVSTEEVSENQHPTDTLQDFNPNVSRMRNAGTNYFLQAAEEISNNAHSKSLEELANQAAKDLKKEAYQRPKEDSYVRLNQTARYIPIRSLPKDADLDSVFEAALTFENQVCGGAKEYTFASLGGDIQERYEKWKALKGLGSSYTQETASMSPNAVYLQAINLQALGKERPAWISELRWNEALNYDKNKLNKITAELEQEDQKRRLKRSDGAYPDDVSLNGMYHANYTALMASDIYNNGTNKTIFVLFQDGRIRPLQAPDPSILRGGVEAQRELFRRQYEKMTFGEEGKEGYTDPYEKNRVVGNFLQNGEVCHIIYFPYMIEQRRWDDAQELIKIGLGGKFNEEGVLLNPDDRLQIVPVVVKNGESEEDAIAKAKVELDNEISKKLPYKETYLQQQIAQAREALKKEQERLKQLGKHDAVKGSYLPPMFNSKYFDDLLESSTEEGVKRSDEVALARGNIRKLEESIKKYTQALEALRTGDKVGAWGGFLEGISDLDNWTFGLYNLRENLVAVKAHEGKMGQEAKDRLGLARSLSQESMSAFHRHGEGRLYGPAFGAGYSFPFTIGAIATYGAGNVAARGIIRGGSRMAAKYGTNWLFDTTIRATTRLAAINAAGVIDSSFQMPRIISDAAIEKMGLMNYTFDENQRIVVTGTQQEKSWGHSLLHSGLNTLVQNVSERVGTYVLEPVAKAFGIGKISLRSFGEAFPYNKTIHMIQNGAFAKAMSKVYGTFEKGGYDGFVNEVLEEYIANPMTATFDENYTFADIFDSRQNLDTALSVWASSILMLGLSSTASSVKYYRTLRSVNNAYDKAEANARRLFGNENWDKIQNTILRLEGEPLVNAIYAGVCQNKSLSDEQKKAFLNYVRAQKAQAVFNNAVSEKYSFSLTGEELNEMNAMTIHAYAEGRNMQTPQEYAQAQQAFADTREMAMSALGVTDDIDAYLDTLGETPAEQLKKGVEAAKENGLDEKAANAALSAYLNAREQQKGAMDGITSDESIRRQHADNVIRQITFENEADSEGGSGKVILVNVKGREKPVFLIRGRYENGSITGETVVVSEGNGVIEMIPASEVEGIVEESDAMTERQRKYDKIDAENKEQQRLINLNMDTPLAGQGGILMDEEGHRRQVGIKCVFNDEQGNPASVLVVDQNNNDYLIPIDVFREQRGRGRKFEAIEPYLDETDEEYHAAEGPMNEEYNLANKEQEGVSEEDAQGAAEGVTPQSATDATEKPTKPEVKYDYHVKMKDGSGNAVSGRVTNLSADGVEIEFDAPYNGKMVDRIPLADFDNGVSEIADANGNVLWNETEAVGDTEVAPQVDATPTQVGQEDAEKSAIAQAEQEHKPTALERIPVNEAGERMFEQADKETALDALDEMTGHNSTNTAAIVKAQYKQAQADLDKLKKKAPTRKEPVLRGTPMEMLKAQQEADANYNAAMTQYNAQVAEAEAKLDAWTKIYALMNERERAAREQAEAEQRERDKKLHDEAVAKLEEQKRIAAEKAAEQEAVGTHAVNPKIKKKWNDAVKIEGNANAITLADGSTIRGRYVLTESGAATASHDVNNAYEPTEGFPIDENGESVNDRDYKRDKDAQRIVREMADNYDSRALQTPVIVSKDGVVLSGNNRTMSGELAAQQGTDKAYIDYLREFGKMFGFTSEQIEGMKHPRVVFVLDEALPYDAKTFARFNAEQQKRQNKPEHAVKLGKIVPDSVFASITNDISRFDRMSDFYADEKSVDSAISKLLEAGVINEMQLPELRTGNSLSASGKELIENALIGKVFQSSPDAVRQIIGNPTLRQSIIMGLNEIANNRTLAKSGYDLSQELGAAVDLVARAKTLHPDIYKEGVPVSPFGREQGLFDDEYGDSRVTDGIVLLLADLLNSGKPSELRKVLASYNNEAAAFAAGQIDMFSGEVTSKEELLNNVLNHFRNATPKEQQAIVDAAVAERKRRAEASKQVGDASERSGSDVTNAEVGNSKDAGNGQQDSSKKTNTDKITPIGESDFGFVYDQFKGNAQGAIQQLMKMQDGEALGALHHDEIGDIDLVWGKAGTKKSDGYGLAKLVKFHPEVLDNLQGILDGMHITMRSENRVQLESDEYQAAVRLTWNGKEKLWLLTAFKKKETPEPTNSRTDVDSNLDGKSDDTATRQSSDVSTDKVTESSPSTQENRPKNSTQSAVKSASAEVETSPTEAQKKAGNYKMGHVKVGAFDVTIENPKGSERSGTDANGKKWSVKMNNTYGYIRGTEGVDGDHIDVFLAEDMDKWDGKYVFVVDQYNPDGTFDEHKVMLGFNSMEEARSAYLSNYEKGWENGRRIDVARIKTDGFQKWVDSSHRKTKPFAHYVIAGAADVAEGKPKNESDRAIPPSTSDKVRMQKAQGYSEFTEKHGVNADDVRAYAEGMALGNVVMANQAFTEIRRTKRIEHRGMKLSEFAKAFKPIKEELYEKFGNVDELNQEYERRAEEERNMMEAARKKAEEEERKRQAHLDELSLLDDAAIDERYMEAFQRGDEATAREMLDEAARRKGYGDTASDYQGVGAWVAPANPGYENDADRRADVEDNAPDVNIEDIALGYSLVDEKYWQEPRKYMQTDATAIESVNAIREAIAAVRRGEKNVKVKVYRAVPTSVKEGKLRNGDWVTPSKDYAKMHGEHRLEGKYRIIEDEVSVNDLWWDGNDSREWGFDNGKGYKYKNVKNNRKSDDLVTRDDKGNVIPPSKRFNQRKADERYQKAGTPLTPNSAEVALRDAIADLMRKSGLDVLESKEGQRVLDEANGMVRQMSFGEAYDYEAYPLGRVEPNLLEKEVNVVKADADHGFANYKEAKAWAKENVAKVYDNEESGGKGDVRISNAAIDKFMSQSAIDKSDSKDVHMAVLKVLPDVLKSSIDVETHPDFLKGEDGKRRVENGMNKDVLVHRCYGAVSIDGKPYRVKMTLKEDPRDVSSPHVTHSYEATKIELLAGTWENQEGPSPNTNNSISAAKLLENVGLSYNSGEKVLDASKKRSYGIRKHRVYHGSGVRFFRTSNGEAYGFTVGGKIYIDPRIATAETPIHEYAHLWATAMREGNPTEWKNIVGLMKGTSVWAEVQKLYPELKNDDDIADEVLATFSGRRGAERLRAEQQKIMQGDGSVFEKAAAVGALARVKQALSKFWKGVADFLGIHYTSAEEVADRVMKDLLEGVDPREFGETKDDGARFSAKQKKALETVSFSQNESYQQTAISSADGAKVLKKLDTLAERYTNSSVTNEKTFIGEVANSLGIYAPNRSSKYASFETKNGKVVTIRLSNHNAKASNFDMNNEADGISIVVSPKKNEGITNDGNAHITEFYYDSIKLRRADGKPLAEIVRSIKQALYSGEFKDTTGLAERQEVNGDDVIRFLSIGEQGAATSDHTEEVTTRIESLNIAREIEDTTHTAISSESKAQTAQKATANLNLSGRVVVHESAEGLEGREATAKGWYDTKTGQIHVVLSNNADAADVTQTILHEAVAHHGLRELFGHNVMDAFLDSVLAAASQEVKDAINELRRGNGWNFRTATEEYLAGLAERTDFERMTAEERGLFATIRRLFNRALEFLGLKNHELSDRELAYTLWCSYQNLKTGEKGRYVAEAERIAMRYKLKAGKNAMTDTEKKDHSVLLRGKLDNLQEILAKDTYERLVTSGSHLERTAWVDMLSPLQDLQHAIEKNGGFKLGDFENPYNAYITMSSRNYAQMDIYKRTLYADMIEAIHALGSETGRSYEEIKTYVMAKHGMERQKYMAEKAAEEAYDRYKSMHPFGQKTLDDFIDEYEEKSFAGLTELFGTQSVSDAMDEAQKYVEEVEAEAGSLTDSMWDSIRAATKSSLQRAYEAGLISKETYDNVSSMYQYYIPLRGFDEATSDEVYEYFGDQTINGGTGSFMKKAKGRKSVADDPFAVIGNMAEMAIMQSNRNLMKQQLLNLALNHPSDLISVSDLYVKFDEDYDNGDGTRGAWVPVAVPDTSGMTTEEANQVMLDFQDDMEEKVKAEPDTYALAHQKPHIPYRVLGRNMNEHQVMVKRGGKTYILTINGNPRAAQAINGLLNPDATENPGAIALKAMTNWIARMATARNVEFAISNAMRDLEFSTTLIPKEGTEYYGRYVKNYLTCVKNIGRLVNRLNGNTLDMSNPLEKAFYDFIYNGGETGYTFMKGVERYKGEITKALSELRAKEGKSKTERLGNKIVYGHHYIINDAWNIYMKGAEYLSRCTEDWVRFAVFLTSRQSGRSMEQSIMDAKEVTVNFNRKGAGSKSAGKWDVSNFFSMNNLHFLSAYAASAFKNFYAFSNASIQGLDKNVRLHLNHTAGMLMWDGAAVTLGMLSAMCIPLMLSAIGGDPDDYWDMPESMRRMGIMLPLGKDGRFLTLPMSIEHRAAYGIGELLGTVVCGSENLPASEITFQAFEQLSQILPLDLTEGNGSMLSLVPTAVRPEVEIAFNKNWLGMPIYKEPFNKNTPAFRNVYQSTNPNYIAMSKWLNEVQGGGDYERAGVQVNPAMVQHLVESYTGGAGKFVSRTSGVIAKIIQGEQIRSNEIPFYRTLVKSVDDRTHNRAARERFQREYDKGQKLIYKIDNYQKESARGNSQYVKELDEFAKSKDFMSYMLWKSYNSVKSQFDNARSYIGDDKDKRAALDHAQMLVQKMMTECARAVENSKTQEEADEKIGRIQSEYTPQIKETLSKVEE